MIDHNKMFVDGDIHTNTVESSGLSLKEQFMEFVIRFL